MLQQELVGTSEYRAERGLAPPSGVEHLNSKAMSAAIPVPKCTQYPVCYRERVRRFYQKYDPKKLESLDAIMLQFAGREDKLIMALLVHYGPEPESEIFEISSTPSPGSDLTLSTARGPVKVARVRPPMSQYRARMQAMYQKYDPEMLGSVDTMLAQYIGKEDELMHKLLARYGPEPEFTGSQRCGSETMPLRTAQRSSVDVCSSRKDNQTALEIRALLTRYYTYYAPENLCNLDHILKTFEGKEDELIRTLHIAFGPAPRDEDLMRRAEQKEHRPSKSEPSDLESEGVSIHMNVTLPEEGIRARLVHMLQVYDPQSLSQLPSLIKQHDNNEEMLLQDLIRRYGPEPQVQDKYADLDTQLTEILNSFNSGSIRRAQKLKCVEHEYRVRVFNMLRFYDPENLTAIDSILVNYRGKQNQMMRDLVSRYGPEPLEKLDGGRYLPTYRTYHQRLTRFYAHYDPDRLCEIDEELSYHFGHEEALMRLLCSMYGPEEFSSQSPHPAESVENQISKIQLPTPTDSFAAQKQSVRRTEVLQASFYFHQ